MKRLFKNIVLLLLPLLLLFVSFLIFDPFSILHRHLVAFKSVTQEAYDITKMDACSKLNLKNYNSFVFGNSKCNGFKAASWKAKLSQGDSILNFSSPGENISHITNKIKFIQEQESDIDNVLIVLDDNIFKNHKGKYLKGPVYLHHFISTDKTKWNNIDKGFGYFVNDFYFVKYFKKCLNINTASNNFILLGKEKNQRRYNHALEIISKTEKTSNAIFIDTIKQTNFVAHKKDSLKLINLKNTFEQEDTDFKIVIGPYYNNTHFSKNLKRLLNNIFGKENVYDFSKTNKFIDEPNYWIDNVHFTSEVGDQILDSIYTY